MVFEIVLCFECGQHYLRAREEFDGRESRLVPEPTSSRHRDFENDDLDDLDEGAEEEVDTSDVRIALSRLLSVLPGNENSVECHVKPETGLLLDSQGGSSFVKVLPSPSATFDCPNCQSRESRAGRLFRPARTSGDFQLSVSVPTLLENTPPATTEGSWRPFEGRRLITFTDSRQGTARFAARAQLEAERNHIRDLIYHLVASRRASDLPERQQQLEEQIRTLRSLAEGSPALRPILAQKEGSSAVWMVLPSAPAPGLMLSLASGVTTP